MTDERLAFLEAHFRNPHSVGGLSEYGIELIDELRIVRAELRAAEVAALSKAPVIDTPLKLERVLETGMVPPSEAPTPPMGVDRKKAKR
jgi:hypothetical protein